MLKDNFNRQFSYLRLSITEVCNFRCSYCLPNGSQCKDRKFLTLPEIRRLLTAVSELGVQKVRITGGEPTARKDFVDIARLVTTTPGIHKVSFTTNGYRLARDAEEFYQAGLRAVNLSVDSLNPETFAAITGHAVLHKVLAGIKRAIEIGFTSLKVNVTLLKGVNDSDLDAFLGWIKEEPITVRFIELMQTRENFPYFQKHHVGSDHIRSQLLESGWKAIPQEPNAGPAVIFTHPDYCGKIGIIAPYTENFCDSCNRLRISSRGNLHLCLFGDISYPLRHLLEDDGQKEELKQFIQNRVGLKNQSHLLQEGKTGSNSCLALIGG